jgi:F-type H+-transporting ATPase subunit delta
MPNVGDVDNTTNEPVKHYPHEDTASYARELMTEVRAAEIRLQSLIDEHDPSITVTATTAIPMDELLRVKATSTAEAIFHAPVYLIEAVDPSIIGGIILEALGKRYDASIRAQLSAVHKGLVSGKRGA